MHKRRAFILRSALGTLGLAFGGGSVRAGAVETPGTGNVPITAPGKKNIHPVEAGMKIREALDQVRVLDPHCHLDSDHPGARNIADILLYHHVWIELISAGMRQDEVSPGGLPHELTDPGMEPAERVRRAMPYLPRIFNTTVGMMLKWLIKDIYGLEFKAEQSFFDTLASEIDLHAGDDSWPEKFFRHVCGIDKVVTVEKMGRKSSPLIAGADERLRALNIADGKFSPREQLQSMAAVLGHEIRTASDYQDFAARLVLDPSRGSPLFLSAWMPGFFTDELAQDKHVTAIIGKALEGDTLSPAEMGSVSYFGMTAALETLRKTKLRTIQLIAGAEVLLPHRSITSWNGSFPGSMARLASQFGDFRFNLSVASDVFTQDIAVLAKHIPNISLAGYWWHTLYPYYIRKSVETRLDLVPASKIIAFFSDAYHCEWCWPKLKLVKQIIGEVLTDRVSRGMYDLDTALSVIPVIFHDAPKEIYGMQDQRIS